MSARAASINLIISELNKVSARKKLYGKRYKQLTNIFYKGIIKRENLSDVLSDYNFFLFPTKNENYGHVIVESLFNGLIPIISDNTTPFSDFISNELGMGFELNKNSLKLKLESIVQVSNAEILMLREKCGAYCKQLNYLND
jgi:hypothetical protein